MLNLECYVQLYCDGSKCERLPVRVTDKFDLIVVSLGNEYHYKLTVEQLLNLLERQRLDWIEKNEVLG